MNAALTANLVDSTTSGVLAGDLFQHMDENWHCSQVETELDERCAMDWLMDDEMRQWEEVSKDEEVLDGQEVKDGKLQVEKVRSAPELLEAQTQVKKADAGKEKKRMIAGWSTKMLKETANRQECQDTEEMVQWRHISQEGIDGL